MMVVEDGNIIIFKINLQLISTTLLIELHVEWTYGYLIIECYFLNGKSVMASFANSEHLLEVI